MQVLKTEMILEEKYLKKVSLSHRKKFAQFFTPEPIAQIMVNWILGNNHLHYILEPAFGLGIFSRLILKQKQAIKITGFELDPVIFAIAKDNFSHVSHLNLCLKDYLFHDWHNCYDGIICNPPYLKFHDYANKIILPEIEEKLNINLSGFTNLYSLFLLKSISQLKENGRIAYLIPSEFLNSNYGKSIKDYLLKSQTLRHIIIFDFQENIFDQVLTTSAIFLLAKDAHHSKINFSTIKNIQQLDSIDHLLKTYPQTSAKISINHQNIDSQIKWRNYYQPQASINYQNLIPFHQIAKVVRGIATGANDYFIFNVKKAQKYAIAEEFLLPCITKSKNVTQPFFTEKDFFKLKQENQNIFLLNIPKDSHNPHILNYLKMGKELGIDQKYLTSKRKPWFALESRSPSPIWVGVFNRNGLKFIRNEALISNLTTFHCIYLKDNLLNPMEIDLLFAYLLTEIAQQLFNDHRREYGDGLTKFEPNDLNNALILDLSILDQETKTIILKLYQQYRTSILSNQANQKLINQINQILKDIYSNRYFF